MFKVTFDDGTTVKVDSSYTLGYIADADLFKHVKDTLDRLTHKVDLKSFEKNVIDPIKLTIEAHAYGKSEKEVIEQEIARQLGKTLENAVGDFHQNIFNYINGWSVPDDGVDIINDAGTVFCEMKNKYNTMNSGSADKVFDKLHGIVIANPKATAYLVLVIAKKSCDEPWLVAGRTLPPNKANRLRKISIDRFYALATGDEKAFAKLCQVLGKVVDDVLKVCPSSKFTNTVLKEITARDPELLRGLFMASFATYNGFEDFHVIK